jgi:hypothetical protein
MPGTGRLPDWTSARAVRFAPTYPENERLLSWLRTETPEPVIEPELPIVDWRVLSFLSSLALTLAASLLRDPCLTLTAPLGFTWKEA